MLVQAQGVSARASTGAVRPSGYKNPGKMPIPKAEGHEVDLSSHISDIEDENDSPSKDDDEMTDIKKKFDPKDPARPRRKKARRACFACQRAHLTCGKFISGCLVNNIPCAWSGRV